MRRPRNAPQPMADLPVDSDVEDAMRDDTVIGADGAPKRTEISRSSELSQRPAIRSSVLAHVADVEQAFIDQRSRVDDTMDYWDAYNSKLGDRQFYQGNSRIFVPIIRNAVRARKTRFVNQIFPQAGRYVDVVTENGDVPHAIMAMMEHYVRRAKLRTQVMPALAVSGDVEGQMTVYVDWDKCERHTIEKTKISPTVDMAGPGEESLEVETGEDDIDDVESVVIVDAGPTVEVIADADILVFPQTVDSIDEALANGGSVTVRRRWSKAKLRKMARDGDAVKAVVDNMVRSMGRTTAESRDARENQAEAAGIKVDNEVKYVLGYETWMRLKVQGDWRLCRVYYAGGDRLMSVKLCPYWNDKVPIISGPVEKAPGVFKGRSLITDVIDSQVLANDAVNEGADTAHFSAMPIIMTDPEKNPRVGSMLLNLAAIWETNPQATQFAQFPALWKDSFAIVGSCKSEIFQTLGVNPSMVPQSTGGDDKRNQAEIANEQQVDIITTADAVWVIEETILTPLLERFADYDYQFRNEPMTIKAYGQMGLNANMEEVPPMEAGRRYEFRWFGVEAARNAAQFQQQIAWVNVVAKIPPTMYAGYQINLAPMLIQGTENVFGPRLAPQIFKDMKDQLSVSPETENQMLAGQFQVDVHPLDDDAAHLQVHMQLMQGGDPSQVDPMGAIRMHIMAHQQQIQQKTMQQAQAMAGHGGMPGQGPPGQPPGPPQGPGGPPPGGPGLAPGAMPGTMRGMRQPPGAIPPDNMPAAGATPMPRQM